MESSLDVACKADFPVGACGDVATHHAAKADRFISLADSSTLRLGDDCTVTASMPDASHLKRRKDVAKSTYETLCILDSNHYARDPGGVSKQIADIVSECGGKVEVNRLWMEQKLAYPIDGHQKGTYWLTYFEMEGVDMPKLDRAFQLCEPVLRQMTLKIDPRLVEPILENARGGGPVTSSAAAEAEAAEGGEEAASDKEAE